MASDGFGQPATVSETSLPEALQAQLEEYKNQLRKTMEERLEQYKNLLEAEMKQQAETFMRELEAKAKELHNSQRPQEHNDIPTIPSQVVRSEDQSTNSQPTAPPPKEAPPARPTRPPRPSRPTSQAESNTAAADPTNGAGPPEGPVLRERTVTWTKPAAPTSREGRSITISAGPMRSPPLRAPPATPTTTPSPAPMLGTIARSTSFGSGSAIRTTVLDRSNRGLTELPEELFEKPYIRKLLLFRNQLGELSERLSELKELEVLDVSHNRLTAFPAALTGEGALPALRELLLEGNRIGPEGMPPLAGLRGLTRVSLRANKLKEFPLGLLEAPHLEELDLGRNCLAELPADLARLALLRDLNLADNRLAALPDAVAGLTALQRLVLADNALTALPDALGALGALSELDVSSNRLCALPASAAELSGLVQLNAGYNSLDTLPPMLDSDDTACWPSLEVLQLGHNRLSRLPRGLWRLTQLQVLDVTANLLAGGDEALPASGLAGLVALRVLKLGRNRLDCLPATVGELACLEELNVFDNRLRALPATLWTGPAAASLTRLYAGYNALDAADLGLPPQSAFDGTPEPPSMRQLEELFLSGNPLGPQLPDTLWRVCAGLKELHVAGVGLADLPAHDFGLPLLTGLLKLDVSRNALSALPANMSALASLQYLNAAHNRLAAVDVDFDGMHQLAEVGLEHNQLSTVPAAVVRLKEQRPEVDVLLDGNPCAAAAASEGGMLRVATAEMVGRRPTMEDAFLIQYPFGGCNDAALFGLFDGHAGRLAATFAAEAFPRVLAGKLWGTSPPTSAAAVIAGNVEQVLAESFATVNEQFREHLGKLNDPSVKHCGATGLVVLLLANRCYVANVGDTRAVLAAGGNTAVRLSCDHKPLDDEEEERIRSLGGYVLGSTGRVNGLLAVSRAIGDFYMHPFVSVDPYVLVRLLAADDRFLIIACDGVWDELEDDEAVSIVGRNTTSLVEAAARLRDFSYLLGSDDNISVILVDLTTVA